MNDNTYEISSYQIAKTLVNNVTDDYAKWQLQECPDLHNSINKLREEGLEFFINEGFVLEDLGCPVKIAQKYLGKVNDETIKKAFMNINFTEYAHSADLLGTDERNVYLASKCHCINAGAEKGNILSLLMIANILITLRLSKELFLNYTRSCYIGCDFVRPFKAEAIWDFAQKLPQGIVCQFCFNICSNPFFKESKAEEQCND